MLLDYFE